MCKDCASVYFGRTVATQLDGHCACRGIVVAFVRSARRYTIEYTDGTTAMLTTTALKKALLPVGADETASLGANETSAAASVVENAKTAVEQPDITAIPPPVILDIEFIRQPKRQKLNSSASDKGVVDVLLPCCSVTDCWDPLNLM